MPQKVSFTPDSCCEFFVKLELLSKFCELDSALNESDLAIKSLGIGPNDMERLHSCTVMFGTVLELHGQLLDATSSGPDNGAFGFTVEFLNVKLTSLAAMGIKLGTPAEVEYGLNATAMVHIKAFAEKLHAVPIEGEVLRVLIGTD
jgi:hypothetical protein